jgi:hypothetical protein
VSVLERADDEELQCYLLQLVQALRFERSDKSRLAHFLVNRGMFILLYKFYSECDHDSFCHIWLPGSAFFSSVTTAQETHMFDLMSFSSVKH